MDVIVGASAIFQCVAPIGASEVLDDVAGLPLPRLIDLMERAAERMPASAQEVMKCSRARCLYDHGEFVEAEKLLDSVNTGRLTDDVALDFSEIAQSNLNIMRAELARIPK
jgi:hypothetical protein